MSDEKGTIIETGWAVSVKANPAVREFTGGSSQIATAHHRVQVTRAHLYKAPAGESDGIDLHVRVLATQAKGPHGPIESSVGQEIRLDRFFLDWSEERRAAAIQRMVGTQKFQDMKAIEDALLKNEREFKAALIAMGYAPETVRALVGELNASLFLGKELLVWHERGIWDSGNPKPIRRAIWSFLPPDRTSALTSEAFPELYNEEFRTGSKASAPATPGGATVGLGTPALGVPQSALAPTVARPAPALGAPALGLGTGAPALGGPNSGGLALVPALA